MLVILVSLLKKRLSFSGALAYHKGEWEGKRPFMIVFAGSAKGLQKNTGAFAGSTKGFRG